MNRRAAWLLAVVPAAIAGHVFAYGLAGQVQNDTHHAYLAPALHYSTLVLVAACVVRVFAALAAHKPRTAHLRFDELWIRLCIAQILLYVAVESVEGFAVTPLALCAQVVVAVFAAAALTGFSRLIASCEQVAIEASRYSQRGIAPVLRVFFNDRSSAYALRIAAGTARFGRPPPHR